MRYSLTKAILSSLEIKKEKIKKIENTGISKIAINSNFRLTKR